MSTTEWTGGLAGYERSMQVFEKSKGPSSRPPSGRSTVAPRSKWSILAVVLALALFAAACGSEASTAEDSVAADGSSSADPSAEGTDAEDTGAEDPSATEQESEQASSGEGTDEADTAAATTQEPAGPKPGGDHVFPNLNTVKISDGSTINLADELAGGDTPVLLWFFAPH